MTIDYAHPLAPDLYDSGTQPDVLEYIRDNMAATAKWLEGVDPPGKQTGFKRINSGLLQEWNGTAWVNKPLAYIPKTGAADITGSLSMQITVGGGYYVKLTDAPADKRITAMAGNAAGEGYFARSNDAGNAWTAGMRIGADGKVYDIATGKPFITNDPAGAYLPLTGGTLTGNLALDGGGWRGYIIKNPNAPANKRMGQYYLDDAGTLGLIRVNDAGNAFTGGLYVDATNSLREAVTGGYIWHSGNDGAGTGLDADMLDGFQSSMNADPNTVALRDSGGSLIARACRITQPGAYPSIAFKSSAASPSEDSIIYGYSGDGTNRNGDLHLQARLLYLNSSVSTSIDVECVIAGISMSARAWNDPGFQTLYFGTKLNWGYINCWGDSSASGNFYSAFPNYCLGAVTNVVRNQGDGSGNVYASHVLQSNQWTLWIGVTDAGFSVGQVPVRYIAWGF